MHRLEMRVCYTQTVNLELTSLRPIQQRLFALLAVFLVLTWSLPLAQGLNNACNNAGSQNAMSAVTGLKSHETRVMPICPPTSPTHCTMISGCPLSCQGNLALTSDTLRILVFTKTYGFVAFDPTLRSQTTNVFDPPPKA